ncbi:hypothetical protein FQA39_LY18618 [Lamprigera yunnana]|nr:hypothetical protein FQA39_LY18618 [Lamprigera yunnana]
MSFANDPQHFEMVPYYALTTLEIARCIRLKRLKLKLNKQLNEQRQKNITITQQQARTASEPATRQEVPRVTYSAVTSQNIQQQRRPTPLASQDFRKQQTYNVSVLPRDPATTPAEVKRDIENGANTAEAKAAVREIRETKRGVIIRCERKEDAERLNQAIAEKIGERLNSTTVKKGHPESFLKR